LARRTPMGLARVGSFGSHGSGDYAIAFTANPGCRLRRDASGMHRAELLRDEDLSPLLLAVVEATEEAVLNSVFAATTTRGRDGREVKALPVERVRALLAERGVLAKSPAE
ncbi:MAG TPA: P1 family peptidase, partial [Thermoanaerobaculales bacterium]|nr:P1 family peptidase [Thermoanaerobaculales bacterium]